MVAPVNIATADENLFLQSPSLKASKTTGTIFVRTPLRRYAIEMAFQATQRDWSAVHIIAVMMTNDGPPHWYSYDNADDSNQSTSYSGLAKTSRWRNVSLPFDHNEHSTLQSSNSAGPQSYSTKKVSRHPRTKPRYPDTPPAGLFRNQQTGFSLSSRSFRCAFERKTQRRPNQKQTANFGDFVECTVTTLRMPMIKERNANRLDTVLHMVPRLIQFQDIRPRRVLLNHNKLKPRQQSSTLYSHILAFISEFHFLNLYTLYKHQIFKIVLEIRLLLYPPH